MDSFYQLIEAIANTDPKYYLIVAVAISLLFFLYAISLSIQFRSLQKKYNHMIKGSEKRNLSELFDEYFDRIDDLKKMKDDLQSEIDDAKSLAAAGLHHIGIVRYSAYPDVGGDLSFSVALLDGDYSGILITSIFGRDESRTYAKPIIRAESTYKLTSEEQEAIRRASLPRTFTRRGSRKNSLENKF